MKRIIFYFWLFSSTAFLFLGANSAKAHQESFKAMGVVLPRNELPAPDFTLQNSNGNSVSLSDFKGKAVLLNFWATWCVPCKKELPSMQKLYEALKLDGVEVIAISIDRDKQKRIHQYINDYKLTFPVLLDPSQKVRKDYFILGLPTSYLIGADGKLKGFISGEREWDSTASKKLFSTLVQ
jgi:peroxiredoxin